MEADGETSDFDRGDMINFAINKIHGGTATTTAPAEKSMKPTRANEEKRLMQAKNELFDTMPNYVTKNKAPIKDRQAVDGGDQRLRETVGDCEPDRLERERELLALLSQVVLWACVSKDAIGLRTSARCE